MAILSPRGRCVSSVLRRSGACAAVRWIGSLRYAPAATTVFVMVWAGQHFYTRMGVLPPPQCGPPNTLIAVGGTGAAFLYSLAATSAPERLQEGLGAMTCACEAIIPVFALVLLGNA